MTKLTTVYCESGDHTVVEAAATYDPEAGIWTCDECAERHAREALEAHYREFDIQREMAAALAAQAAAEPDPAARFAEATYDDPPF